MELKNGEFYCLSGNSFSKAMSDYFSSNNRSLGTELLNSFDSNDDVRFCCVCCGKRMKRIGEMHEICSSCGFELDKKSYFRLVEMNPHV
jgi:ribosomal protein L37AE/L43A